MHRPAKTPDLDHVSVRRSGLDEKDCVLEVNGRRLDVLLVESGVDEAYWVQPAWRVQFPDSGASRAVEDVIRRRSATRAGSVVLPILLDGDTLSFSAVVVVVEVVWNHSTVAWRRFGLDGGDVLDDDQACQVGTDVRWQRDVGGFIFGRDEYERLLEALGL